MTTSHMPITPLNYFHSNAEQEWWPESYIMFKQELNPRSQPYVDRLQLLRLNLQRMAIRYRDYQRIWQELDPAAAAMTEHKAETYESLWRDVFALEMLYECYGLEQEWATYLDSVLNDPAALREIARLSNIVANNDKLIQGAIANGQIRFESDEQMYHSMLHAGLISTILDMRSPIAVKYENALYHPGKHQEPYRLVDRNLSDSQRDSIQTWATRIAPFQSDVRASFELLLADSCLAGYAFNGLQGAAARNNRILLTDGGIPLPTDATFLGWYGVAGTAFRRLTRTERERLRGVAPDLNPTHILTYIPPMMPRTKEHANRSQIQTDDSHSDHSLTVRSSGHRRDSHNRIEYGIRSVRTVLLRAGHDSAVHVVCDDRNPESALNLSPRAAHLAAISGLPGVYDFFGLLYRGSKFNLDALMPHLGLSDAAFNGWISNPYMSGVETLPFNQQFWNFYTVDTAYRSLSKFLRVHFRFDSEDAHALWCAQFEACAARHVAMTPSEIMHVYFEASLTHGTQKPSDSVQRTKSGDMRFQW